MDNRPSFSDTFLAVAHTMAERGTCPRLKVGAVITRNNRIIATGYNGSPPGLAHCSEVGCLRQVCEVCQGTGQDSFPHKPGEFFQCINCHGEGYLGGCKRAIHAEANALLQCAKVGPSADGSTLYCTHEPCIDCSKLIIGAGIEVVYYQSPYASGHGSEAAEMLEKAGVRVYAIPAK